MYAIFKRMPGATHDQWTGHEFANLDTARAVRANLEDSHPENTYRIYDRLALRPVIL